MHKIMIKDYSSRGERMETEIRKYSERNGKYDVVYEEPYKIFDDKSCDILFLNTELYDVRTIANNVYNLNPCILIILISERELPRPEYFGKNIYGYFNEKCDDIKTILPDLFMEADRKKGEYTEILTCNGERRILGYNEILYIERGWYGSAVMMERMSGEVGKYARIDSTRQMSKWKEELCREKFLTVNSGCMVNISKIIYAEKKGVMMRNKAFLNIADKYRDDFYEKYSMNYGKKYCRKNGRQ